jgi:hypothetical protein
MRPLQAVTIVAGMGSQECGVTGLNPARTIMGIVYCRSSSFHFMALAFI